MKERFVRALDLTQRGPDDPIPALLAQSRNGKEPSVSLANIAYIHSAYSRYIRLGPTRTNQQRFC